MKSPSRYLLTEPRRLLDGPLGALLVVPSQATGGRVAVVEHPLAPRALGAPVHTHRHEDEYSLVLEGTIGAEVGGEVVEAGPGTVLLKPRGVPHAFWNPTDRAARLLELIVPGGFEAYFAELADALSTPGPPDLAALGAIAARHGLDLDPDSIGRLAAEHGLDVGGPPAR
jgi:quercetin dioxygenase-like cupin family protein